MRIFCSPKNTHLFLSRFILFLCISSTVVPAGTVGLLACMVGVRLVVVRRAASNSHSYTKIGEKEGDEENQHHQHNHSDSEEHGEEETK